MSRRCCAKLHRGIPSLFFKKVRTAFFLLSGASGASPWGGPNVFAGGFGAESTGGFSAWGGSSVGFPSGASSGTTGDGIGSGTACSSVLPAGLTHRMPVFSPRLPMGRPGHPRGGYIPHAPLAAARELDNDMWIWGRHIVQHIFKYIAAEITEPGYAVAAGIAADRPGEALFTALEFHAEAQLRVAAISPGRNFIRLEPIGLFPVVVGLPGPLVGSGKSSAQPVAQGHCLVPIHAVHRVVVFTLHPEVAPLGDAEGRRISPPLALVDVLQRTPSGPLRTRDTAPS